MKTLWKILMVVELLELQLKLKLKKEKRNMNFMKKKTALILFEIHIKSSSLILFKSSIFIRFNNYFLSDSSNILITLLTLSAFNS